MTKGKIQAAVENICNDKVAKVAVLGLLGAIRGIFLHSCIKIQNFIPISLQTIQKPLKCKL